MNSVLIERLEQISPEIQTPEAILYLNDASLVLFLLRSYQGLTSSPNKELMRLFELVLLREISDEDIDMIENNLKAEIDSSSNSLDIDIKAQRIKGIFNLLNAAEIRKDTHRSDTV